MPAMSTRRGRAVVLGVSTCRLVRRLLHGAFVQERLSWPAAWDTNNLLALAYPVSRTAGELVGAADAWCAARGVTAVVAVHVGLPFHGRAGGGVGSSQAPVCANASAQLTSRSATTRAWSLPAFQASS